ncbi:MAG: radical SAM protein [Terriglobia bacterium]
MDAVPTFPPAAPLTGIARLAAESPQVRERAEVAYFSLPTRSVLNREASGRLPFAWTINPYRGCEFGCQYCYARYTHEFMELRDGLEFERKIYAKAGASEILRAELRSARDQGLPIALGTATDPYQPAESQFGVTGRLLEVFAQLGGARLSITTKSVLILRDIELLQAVAARNSLRVHMTVTTTDARLARLLEPKAPPPAKRLQAVARLGEAGIYAGVNAMPILPGITDSRQSLGDLVRSAAAARAKFLHGSVLFLMPSAMKHFMPFLKREFPRLAQRYLRLYARSAYLPQDYKDRVTALLALLRAQYELEEEAPPELPKQAQLSLRF